MGIVDRIRALCEQNGITINKLETEASVGRGNVARWDRHRPNIDKVQSVADYFGVTSDFILTGNENKPAENGELDMKELIHKMTREELIDFIMEATAALREME